MTHLIGVRTWIDQVLCFNHDHLKSNHVQLPHVYIGPKPISDNLSDLDLPINIILRDPVIYYQLGGGGVHLGGGVITKFLM